MALTIAWLSSQVVIAQAPDLEFQNTIGGSSMEYLYSVTAVPDNGYLLSGYSSSGVSGASSITGATSNIYTATTNGNFKCRVTKNATGCFKNSNVINVSVTCREEKSEKNAVTLYPNPADDFITIETNTYSEKIIYLSDVTGQLLQVIHTSKILL